MYSYTSQLHQSVQISTSGLEILLYRYFLLYKASFYRLISLGERLNFCNLSTFPLSTPELCIWGWVPDMVTYGTPTAVCNPKNVPAQSPQPALAWTSTTSAPGCHQLSLERQNLSSRNRNGIYYAQISLKSLLAPLQSSDYLYLFYQSL